MTPIDFEKLLTLALILPVYLLISENIMSSVTAIHVKSNGCFINTVMACAVTVLCSFKICITWLKVLIILTNTDRDDVKKVVVIHKWLGEREGANETNEDSKNEKKEEEPKTEAPAEPAQQSAGTP